MLSSFFSLSCLRGVCLKVRATIGIRKLTDYCDANEKILQFKWYSVAYSRSLRKLQITWHRHKRKEVQEQAAAQW